MRKNKNKKEKDTNKNGVCAARYSSSSAVHFAGHCQCRDCQHATGAGHSSFFVVERAATAIDGAPRYFETTGQSGNTVQRGFCPTCGSPVFNTNSGYPDNFFFHAATLDDPTLFEPSRVVYRDSGQPWDHVDPALS